MREIKFRAWLPNYSQMVFSGSECTTDGYEIWKFNPDTIAIQTQQAYWKEEGGETVEVLEYSNEEAFIMQFTGLKDKNGKEIYEGDIVQFPDYRDGAWFGKPQPTRIEVVEYSTYFSAYQELRMYEQLKDRYEVIGNIYENPELIKND